MSVSHAAEENRVGRQPINPSLSCARGTGPQTFRPSPPRIIIRIPPRPLMTFRPVTRRITYLSLTPTSGRFLRFYHFVREHPGFAENAIADTRRSNCAHRLRRGGNRARESAWPLTVFFYVDFRERHARHARSREHNRKRQNRFIDADKIGATVPGSIQMDIFYLRIYLLINSQYVSTRVRG